MPIERRERMPQPPVYSIDISEGWDKESQIEIFMRELKKLPFYRPGLLYSGFDGDQIGKNWGSAEGKMVVFCAEEDDINGDGDNQNPFEFALDYKNPAIAVYNPAGLEPVDESYGEMEGYKIKDLSAILGIIRLT